MFNKMKNRLKNQKGFTLIELLAVIVILGIIAAIAIPSVTKIIENTKADAIKADAKLILNAAKLYQTENGMPAIGFINDSHLETDYIDNVSTFTGNGDNSYVTGEYKITLKDATLVITGVGEKDNVKVTFSDDSLENVDDATVTK